MQCPLSPPQRPGVGPPRPPIGRARARPVRQRAAPACAYRTLGGAPRGLGWLARHTGPRSAGQKPLDTRVLGRAAWLERGQLARGLERLAEKLRAPRPVVWAPVRRCAPLEHCRRRRATLVDGQPFAALPCRAGARRQRGPAHQLLRAHHERLTPSRARLWRALVRLPGGGPAGPAPGPGFGGGAGR